MDERDSFGEWFRSDEDDDFPTEADVRGMGRRLLGEGVGESGLDPPIICSLSSSDDDVSQRSSSRSSFPSAT